MTSPEPVLLTIVRRCDFKAKPCALCGLPKTNRVHSPKKTATCPFKRQNGCAVCARNKGDVAHYGEPPSLNFFSTSAMTGNLFASSKAAWQKILYDELLASGLPTGLGRVYAEGEVTFPTSAKRDQGNFRIIPEKALGDALQMPGPDGRPWLADDSWDFYEFGNLTRRHVPGESALRLTLFPYESPRMEMFT